MACLVKTRPSLQRLTEKSVTLLHEGFAFGAIGWRPTRSRSWSAFRSVGPRSMPHPHHSMQFFLLLRRQFVLDADGQTKMQALDLAFSVQDFIQLRQRQLLVD